MPKSIIAEGKTTNEAISNGLKELNVSKEKVDIKVLENEQKRSFFSILAPRIVKVELTLKDNVEINENKKQKDQQVKSKENRAIIETQKKEANQEDIKTAMSNIEQFLKDFSHNFEEITYELKEDKEFIAIDIQGKDSSKLIGYRGDVLNSLQTIINSIANKNCESRIRVIINIGDYKEKREKALEDLAEKVAKTVLKNGKSITLEPMVAYERKVIHNKLQSNTKIRTYSIGEEPYRKVVIAKNK